MNIKRSQAGTSPQVISRIDVARKPMFLGNSAHSVLWNDPKQATAVRVFPIPHPMVLPPPTDLLSSDICAAAFDSLPITTREAILAKERNKVIELTSCIIHENSSPMDNELKGGGRKGGGPKARGNSAGARFTFNVSNPCDRLAELSRACKVLTSEGDCDLWQHVLLQKGATVHAFLVVGTITELRSIPQALHGTLLGFNKAGLRLKLRILSLVPAAAAQRASKAANEDADNSKGLACFALYEALGGTHPLFGGEHLFTPPTSIEFSTIPCTVRHQHFVCEEGGGLSCHAKETERAVGGGHELSDSVFITCVYDSAKYDIVNEKLSLPMTFIQVSVSQIFDRNGARDRNAEHGNKLATLDEVPSSHILSSAVPSTKGALFVPRSMMETTMRVLRTVAKPDAVMPFICDFLPKDYRLQKDAALGIISAVECCEAVRTTAKMAALACDSKHPECPVAIFSGSIPHDLIGGVYEAINAVATEVAAPFSVISLAHVQMHPGEVCVWGQLDLASLAQENLSLLGVASHYLNVHAAACSTRIIALSLGSYGIALTIAARARRNEDEEHGIIKGSFANPHFAFKVVGRPENLFAFTMSFCRDVSAWSDLAGFVTGGCIGMWPLTGCISRHVFLSTASLKLGADMPEHSDIVLEVGTRLKELCISIPACLAAESRCEFFEKTLSLRELKVGTQLSGRNKASQGGGPTHRVIRMSLPKVVSEILAADPASFFKQPPGVAGLVISSRPPFAVNLDDGMSDRTIRAVRVGLDRKAAIGFDGDCLATWITAQAAAEAKRTVLAKAHIAEGIESGDAHIVNRANVVGQSAYNIKDAISDLGEAAGNFMPRPAMSDMSTNASSPIVPASQIVAAPTFHALDELGRWRALDDGYSACAVVSPKAAMNFLHIKNAIDLRIGPGHPYFSTISNIRSRYNNIELVAPSIARIGEPFSEFLCRRGLGVALFAGAHEADGAIKALSAMLDGGYINREAVNEWNRAITASNANCEPEAGAHNNVLHGPFAGVQGVRSLQFVINRFLPHVVVFVQTTAGCIEGLKAGDFCVIASDQVRQAQGGPYNLPNGTRAVHLLVSTCGRYCGIVYKKFAEAYSAEFWCRFLNVPADADEAAREACAKNVPDQAMDGSAQARPKQARTRESRGGSNRSTPAKAPQRLQSEHSHV